MAYKWEKEVCDEGISAGESIIDYTFISENGFLLIVLLTDFGNLKVNYFGGSNRAKQSKTVSIKSFSPKWSEASTLCLLPNATSIALVLPNGNILLVPMKKVFDIPWGRNILSNDDKSVILIDTEVSEYECLHVPTAAVSYDALYYNRTFVLYSNKAGQIRIIDLTVRKVSIVIQAPESIHALHSIISDHSVHLLVTGFTGAQWFLPLEIDGNSLRGTLGQVIPSELQKVDDHHALNVLHNQQISSLNFEKNEISIYEDIHLKHLVHTFPVPENTWLVHIAENAIFAISNQTSVFFAVHLGLVPPFYPFTFEELKPCFPNEKILGTIPVISSDPVPSWIAVTDKQLLSVLPKTCLEQMIADIAERNNYSLEICDNIAKRFHYDRNTYYMEIIGLTLKKMDLSNDNSLKLSMLMKLALDVPLDVDVVLDVFEEFGVSYLFLPYVLNQCEADANNEHRHKVVNLYLSRLKKFPAEKEFIEQQLRIFLIKYRDVCGDIESLLENNFWSCISVVVSRNLRNMEYLSSYLASNKTWPVDQPFHIVKSLSLLNWNMITIVDLLLARLCDFLPFLKSAWQIRIFAKIAQQHIEKYPRLSIILYTLSMLRLLNSTISINYSKLITNSIVSCGSNCSAVVSEDESLVFWGEFCSGTIKGKDIGKQSYSDSFGISRAFNMCLIPLMPDMPDRICSVSCGTEHVLCLTVCGEVYSFGSNRFGQCGTGNKLEVQQPTRIEGYIGVRCIRAGHYHSMLIDSGGRVFAWGWSLYGQLGLNRKKCNEDVTLPMLVESIREPVIDISCGYAHTVFLTASGSVLTCGCNTYGQLGCEKQLKKRYCPDVIPFTEKVIMISSKFFHSLAITETQRIFQWGISPQTLRMKMYILRRFRSAAKEAINNAPACVEKMPENRELGVEHQMPLQVEHLIPDRIAFIDAGYTHNAIVTTTGSLYTWGKSFDMQLGHGNKKEQEEPHQVFEPKGIIWRYVSCGLDFTVAVASDGSVYAWGRNDRGHLGIRRKSVPSAPRKLIIKNGKGITKSIQINNNENTCIPIATKLPFVIAFTKIDDLSLDVCCAKFIRLLKKADPNAISEISTYLLKNPVDCFASIFVHLLAGDLVNATQVFSRILKSNISIMNEGLLNKHSESSNKGKIDLLIDMFWELITKQSNFLIQWNALSNLQSFLISNDILLQNKRLNAHIPLIFINSDERLLKLQPSDKLKLVENWKCDVLLNSIVQIPQKDIANMGARIRYWNCCGTIEKYNNMRNIPTNDRKRVCSKCSEVWKQAVKSKLAKIF